MTRRLRPSSGNSTTSSKTIATRSRRDGLKPVSEPVGDVMPSSALTSIGFPTTAGDEARESEKCAGLVISASRSPGSFELRYSLGADLAAGKRRIATVTVRGPRKEAERELRRLLRALDTGEHIDPNRITVREWWKTWLDATRQEVAPRTAEQLCRNRQQLPRPDAWEPATVKARTGAHSGRRKPGGLSPRTRRHISPHPRRRTRPRRGAAAKRAQPVRCVPQAAAQG